MSLGHARPELTGMPHLVEARQKAKARSAELCAICQKPGPFGFNVFRKTPHRAVFACRDHREEVAKALE